MNYKKIIKSRQTRIALLKAMRFIPDSVMIRVQYRIKLGRWPDLKHPKRYTEKLQVYKMKYRNPILHHCVDKYEVRKYVDELGLGSLLNKLYGVYNCAEDIDFDKLPDRFVIKTTDGGGGNNIIICKDKKQLNIPETIKTVNSWLTVGGDVNVGREWAYTGLKQSKIIVEKYLENPANPDAGIEDFKILCFGGKPYYVIVDKDRYIDHKRNFYTTDWQRVNIGTDHEQFEEEYPKPNNFDKMLEAARILSAEFPAVRVDLYNIEGHILFGELTFCPWSGYVQFTPDEFDFHLGELFPNYNKG